MHTLTPKLLLSATATFLQLVSINALGCFECEGPHTRDCDQTTICNEHEVCYVEQMVTSIGTIVYKTGCKDNARCLNTMRRRSDLSSITTCLECCNTDYCNNKGCYDPPPDRTIRGPYCFVCEQDLSSADECRTVAICDKEQVCGVYRNLENRITSRCIGVMQCNIINNTLVSTTGLDKNTRVIRCISCCSEDFCNKNPHCHS